MVKAAFRDFPEVGEEMAVHVQTRVDPLIVQHGLNGGEAAKGVAEHADLVEIPPAPSRLVEDEPGIAEARFGRLAQLVHGDLNGIAARIGRLGM
ncbi:hypothetical protein ACWEPL_43950 [Nonomuraea sp. NPDC004186]